MTSKLRNAALVATALGGALAAGPAFTQNGGTVARWNRAGGRVRRGLVRRRAAEAALYLN